MKWFARGSPPAHGHDSKRRTIRAMTRTQATPAEDGRPREPQAGPCTEDLIP